MAVRNRFNLLAVVLQPDEILSLGGGDPGPSAGLDSLCGRGFPVAVLCDGSGLTESPGLLEELSAALDEIESRLAGPESPSVSRPLIGIGLSFSAKADPSLGEDLLSLLSRPGEEGLDRESRWIFVDGWRRGRDELVRSIGKSPVGRTTVSIPFNGEHMLSSQTVLGVHPSFWGPIADDQPRPRLTQADGIEVVFLLEARDSLALPWSDPSYVREMVGEMKSHRADGFVLGTHPPDFSGKKLQTEEHSPGLAARFNFERRWAFYRTFGIYSADSSLDNELMRVEFVRRFGEEFGPQLQEGLELASRLYPLLATVHPDPHGQWYPEGSVDGGGLRMDPGLGWRDDRPYRGVLEFLFHRPAGDEVLSPLEYAAIEVADRSKAGSAAPSQGKNKRRSRATVRLAESKAGRKTPLGVFKEITVVAGDSRNIVDPLVHDLDRKIPDAVRSYAQDVLAVSNLGLHYGAKIRSALELAFYIAGLNDRHKRMAGTFAHQSVAWWKYLTWGTSTRFLKFDLEGLSGFNWDRFMQDVVDQEVWCEKLVEKDPDGFRLAVPYLCRPPLGRGCDFSLAPSLLRLGVDGFDVEPWCWGASPSVSEVEEPEWGGQWPRNHSVEGAFGTGVRSSPIGLGATATTSSTAVLVRRVEVEGGSRPFRVFARLRGSKGSTLRVRLDRGFLADDSSELTFVVPSRVFSFAWKDLGAISLKAGSYVVEIGHEGEEELLLDALFVTTSAEGVPPKSE